MKRKGVKSLQLCEKLIKHTLRRIIQTNILFGSQVIYWNVNKKQYSIYFN